MTVDEILRAFERAKDPPAPALRAAVAHAPALAPRIIELVQKAAGGTYLTLPQEDVLFFGLHALAAARETSAYRPVLELLRGPETTLEWVLGDDFVDLSAQLILSLYDGDTGPIYALLESPETAGTVKWALFRALARLTWEGSADRSQLVDFLDRFDGDAKAPLADCAWEGWQDAILYLGLTSFRSRVEAGWAAGRLPFQNDADRRDYLEQLEQAAAHSDDPRAFMNDGLVRIDDPVAHLAEIERERGCKLEPEYGGPAGDIALSSLELDWLGGFLVSEQIPDPAPWHSSSPRTTR